jgi:phage major head subunit gpT-like protein
MAIITPTLLGSINNALNTAYNTNFWRAKGAYKDIAFVVASDGDSEVYPRLDMLPGLREWIGARVVHELTQSSFLIKNREFEETISVKRTDIADDKYGIYAPVAAQMGLDAGIMPDKLVAQTMAAGTSTITYDGQYFFSTAHPTFTASGGLTTVSNYAAGGGPGWYLLDTSKVLRPFIFQDREPFRLVTRFSPTDPSVFDNNTFLWGVNGRCNSGFGLWQLAYYSTAPMTPANLIAAATAMSTIRRPDGTPMGVTPDTLVTGTALKFRANAYYKNSFVANDPTTPTVLVENDIIGQFKPIEFQWLN